MCDKCDLQPSEFAHLHVHSDGSTLDGLRPVASLVSAAKQKGFQEIALTDHGTVKQVLAFTMACEEEGIKPIVGLEAYVTYSGKRHHLTLLADGMKGFNTLVNLNNLGIKSDDISRPSFDLLHILDNNDGVFLLSGCPASFFQEANYHDAVSLLREFKNAMPGRVFAEGMLVGNDYTFERAVALSKDLSIPLVVTNDVHFPFKEDAPSQTVLTQMNAKFNYQNEDLYLATPNEIFQRRFKLDSSLYPNLIIGMKNAKKLAQKLDVVKFNSTPKLPVIPNSFKDLEKLCDSALLNYLSKSHFTVDKTDEYLHRLEDELSVVDNMGFSTYFIILHDIIHHAKTNGLWIGPGRGSGAGSLILFLLSITEIDPIKYNLSFDRFLNRKRAEMPDVDVDIASIHRGTIVDYAKKKWGAQAVATYSRYSHKSLTHDLGRTFNAPRDIHNSAADGGVDSEAFKKLTDMYGERFLNAYNAMLGQIRHAGQHAGGIVIVDSQYPTPLERIKGDEPVIGWVEGENRELSRVGFVKYDILGLQSGAVLYALESKFGIKPPEPEDDDVVFSLFQKGDTLGIFQFNGSQGIVDFTKRVKPRRFEDLVAINALYRPGALDSGAAQNYPEWREKPRKIHPIIDEILADTFGIICYQEQFMNIFAKVTNQSMSEADLARKVLTKARPGQAEWEAKMLELKTQFFDGCKSHAIPDKTTELIWGEIVTHTRYSFNRSHSVAYAMLAWRMAWWKYHYPADFYAAILTYDTTEWDKYLYAVIALGIEVVPPNINLSTDEFVAKDGKIFLPLSVVKFLGNAGVQGIMQNRPFKNVADFMSKIPKRAVTSRGRKGLYYLGAFDEFEDNSPENLGLKDIDDELTKQAIYEMYMGVFLPSPEFVEMIEEYNKIPNTFAGIITEKEKRTSNYGDYIVYKMNPSGAFWSRTITSYEIGDSALVTVAGKTGKILTIKRIENV